MSWLVLSETGSEFALGKIMASATVPGLIISFFTGYIIDKANRKWLMVFLDVFRIVTISLFLIFLQFNEFELIYLYPVVFFMGIGNSLFWSTSQAFTQQIVSGKEYFDANKLLSASYQIGSILGAGIGGFIVHFYSPFVALWINVATYLISAIFISFAPFTNKIKKEVSKNIVSSLFKGVKYLKGRADITMLSITTILSDVAIWGALSVLTISISIEIFDKGSWGYGVLDGMYGIGAFLSIIIVGFLTNNYSRRTVLQGCYLFGFLSLSFFYNAKHIPSITFFLLLGININASRVITRTILMENINNKIMGRAQTVIGIYSRIMVVTSSLFTGYIIENYSIDSAVIFTCMHYFIAFLGITMVGKIWIRSREYLYGN